MVTLNSADSALKSFYLDAVSESLNMKINPFLAKIEKTSNYVTGKDVRKTIRVGVNGGIGAGTETGALPEAKNTRYIQMATTLKNLYGTIEISDKAIRASANNEGAFVNLVNEEMQSLVKSASNNFGRMLFGDGTGRLSMILESDGDWVYVDNIQNFAVGMYVDIFGMPSEFQNLPVLEINRADKCIRLNVGDATSEDLMDTEIFLHGSMGNDIIGLGAIFSEEPLYGLEREEIGMKPYINHEFGGFTVEKLEHALDMIEERSSYRPNFIVCSWGVRRAITEYCRKNNVPMKDIEIEGGYKAIELLGVPVVVDKFCPEKTMYLLNTDHFKLCQLCDWQWLEAEDGKILKQVPGKPVYTATLVKYADLLCENPAGQGKLEEIIER